MFQAKQVWWSWAVIAAVSSAWMSQAEVARAEGGDKGVLCVMDVEVQSKNQTGTVIGTEIYRKEFILAEGGTFFDDFSTRTRFKFFTASMEKVNGESTVKVNWSADVTVFNAVDFNTSVTLANGQKSGNVAGDNTFFTSNGSTKTTFSLSCLEN